MKPPTPSVKGEAVVTNGVAKKKTLTKNNAANRVTYFLAPIDQEISNSEETVDDDEDLLEALDDDEDLLEGLYDDEEELCEELCEDLREDLCEELCKNKEDLRKNEADLCE